ncbi:hypothetical protein PLESTF_001250200 [Pleodorina starrii]|nr:hypothetical protein PLESTF_001250200 [Pleodorina starrii]
MSFALKKQIKKELLDSDWAGKVEEAAVTALATILAEQHGGQLHALQDILRACTSDLSADGKITAASVQAAAVPNGGAQQVELVEFTDAFNVPRLAFDPVQRKLYLNNKPRHIHASAEAKHQVYLQRLLLIQQRLQRSRMFQQSNLLLPGSGGRGASVQLTDLQSLMGVFGATRYVLGCISRSEDGRYVLEDTTGALPLDLSAAETAAGFYTENCVVIAEGWLGHDGAFHVKALGLPPAEPRSALPLAAQRLNLWGGAGGGCGPDSEAGALLALEEAQRGAADRIVVLANVWLDRQEVLDSLHTVLAGFSGVLTVPAVFVFMGNYHSRAGAGGGGGGGSAAGDGMLGGHDVDYGIMRELFGQLAGLIDQYPRLKAESRFVFLPGPDDPGPGAILPQPPLPRSLTGELRRVLPGAVFASNPVRLRYATQRIVLFRHDLQRRLRRRTLLPLSGAPDGAAGAESASQAGPSPPLASQAGPSPSALWGHLALTLLQQGHIAPLPLLAQPVYWQHDGALALYPLPDAVILADATAGQEDFTHEGCHVINPGCLPGGFFAAYLPCVQQVEMSELPRPGEGGADDDGGDGDGGGDAAGDLAVAVDGDGVLGDEQGQQEGALGEPRAPLRQRQQPQQQQQRAGQKSGEAAAGKAPKPRQPRAAKQGGGQGGRGRGRPAAQPRDAAGEDHDAAAAAGDGGEDVAAAAAGDEDVEMAAAGGQAAAARKAPERRGATAGGGRGGRGRGAGRGRGGGAAAAAGAVKGQGTLSQAWAKQPARVGSAEDEAGLLEDLEDQGQGEEAGAGGDVEMVEDGAGGEAAAAQRRRQHQQARKRRAMVIEEDEEEEAEEKEGGVGEEEAEGVEVGRAGGGGGGGGGGKRTWLDEDEEDWREEEEGGDG